MLREKYFFLRKTQPQMLYGRQVFLTSVITSIAVISYFLARSGRVDSGTQEEFTRVTITSSLPCNQTL